MIGAAFPWAQFEIYLNVLFSSVVYVVDKLIPCCTQSLSCREFVLQNKEDVYCGPSWCNSIPTQYFDGRAFVYKCFRNVSSVLLIVVITRVNFDVRKVCCLRRFISEKQKRRLVSGITNLRDGYAVAYMSTEELLGCPFSHVAYLWP